MFEKFGPVRVRSIPAIVSGVEVNLLEFSGVYPSPHTIIAIYFGLATVLKEGNMFKNFHFKRQKCNDMPVKNDCMPTV